MGMPKPADRGFCRKQLYNRLQQSPLLMSANPELSHPLVEPLSSPLVHSTPPQPRESPQLMSPNSLHPPVSSNPLPAGKYQATDAIFSHRS
jgi:hypothetical protein